MDQTRWADLLTDVVCEIAGWLDDVVDFVRFHAVCKAWRASRDAQPQSSRTTTTQFLPWLMAADGKDLSSLRFRCIFSKSSYRSMLPSPLPRYRMCSTTAVRYLTTGHPSPSLYDPLTGEATHNMPRLPYNLRSQWDKNSPKGIIYGDGTILLCSSSITNVSYNDDIRAMFTAALLRPGDAKWTLIERTFDNVKHLECRAAYHGGRILVTIGASSILRVITPDVAVTGDLLVPVEYQCKDSYVFESRGELLWASVRTSYNVSCKEGTRKVHALWVFVQKLEESSSAQGNMRWVRKDERSLADCVLFLGSPDSFAIDASQLRSHGGCAYFVYNNSKGQCKAFPPGHSGVFRYNFLNAKTDFVERVPPGWDNEKCTWLVPQPAIAPIQEITKSCKALEVKPKQQKTAPVTSLASIIHILKHYEHCFRVMVRNLPLAVNSSQLELFFRKHGKVSSTEVLYDKDTKCSQGVGFVTMSTVHAHPQDAVDAFGKMFLDGCGLEVTLVKQGRPRYHQRRRLPS